MISLVPPDDQGCVMPVWPKYEMGVLQGEDLGRVFDVRMIHGWGGRVVRAVYGCKCFELGWEE